MPSKSGYGGGKGKRLPTKRRLLIANEGIKRGTIKRIAQRAGVKSMSSRIEEPVNVEAKAYLRKLLFNCAQIAMCKKRKGVNADIVRYALRVNGTPIYAYDPKRGKHQ